MTLVIVDTFMIWEKIDIVHGWQTIYILIQIIDNSYIFHFPPIH